MQLIYYCLFFNRGEYTQHEEPFRAWFSKNGELRSVCPRAQMIALTATSGLAQRRKIMKHLCSTGNNEVIVESPFQIVQQKKRTVWKHLQLFHKIKHGGA
jgi:superfamily II DNA helicase RecQ